MDINANKQFEVVIEAPKDILEGVTLGNANTVCLDLSNELKFSDIDNDSKMAETANTIADRFAKIGESKISKYQQDFDLFGITIGKVAKIADKSFDCVIQSTSDYRDINNITKFDEVSLNIFDLQFRELLNLDIDILFAKSRSGTPYCTDEVDLLETYILATMGFIRMNLMLEVEKESKDNLDDILKAKILETPFYQLVDSKSTD